MKYNHNIVETVDEKINLETAVSKQSENSCIKAGDVCIIKCNG